MKKRLLLLLSVLAFSTTACDDNGLTLNVGEQQIESKMAAYFPYHKEALMGSLKLDLSDPDLILKDGSNRAELIVKSAINTGGVTWPGQLHLSFGLDYAADTGTFYLVEPRVESVDMSGIPATVSAGFTRYLLPLVQQYLTRVPVYTLKADASTGQNIARHTLKKIAIQDKNLKVTLGMVDAKQK